MNPNMIVIEGKGKTAPEIANMYFELIRNDFYVTLDEIKSFLSCSALYVIQNIRPHVKHIVVNTVARKIMMTAIQEDGAEEDLKHLILKRVLFSHQDTYAYIQHHLTYEQTWEHVPFSLFQSDSKYRDLLAAAKSDEKGYHFCRQAAKRLYKPENTITRNADHLPDQLYSLQDLKKMFMQKHDIEVYRMIKDRGINKYYYVNLVRYDLHEFQAKLIPIPIMVAKEGAKVYIGEIIEEATKLAKQK